MMCIICLDTRIVERHSDSGSVRELVTCPACVRGVRVIGAHERLRAASGPFMEPGTILAQFVRMIRKT